MNRTISSLIILCSMWIQHTNAQVYQEMIDSGNFRVAEIVEAAEAYFSNSDKGRGSGYVQFKRWEYNALRLQNENGFLATDAEELQEFQRYNAYLNRTAPLRSPLQDNWEELGPDYYNATTSWNPGVGRVTGIAIQASNSNHMLLGANTGGVWNTFDGGQTWAPLSDFFNNLKVYSVAMHPTDPSVYFFGSSGGMIFSSTDAGATWNLLGNVTAGNSVVNKILIHPQNPAILFATVSNSGIFRSSDAGLSWTRVALSDFEGYDIEFQPDDPSVVFASGSKVHKSIDGVLPLPRLLGFRTDRR